MFDEFEVWANATQDLRSDRAGRALVGPEVVALRGELATLHLPETRETLLGYLHGLGQAQQHIAAASGFFDTNPRGWATVRAAAVVELADALGIVDAA
jgi:hypothetical protein